MKNTIENKAKFFAQYWGQKVFTHAEYKQAEVDYVTEFSFGFMRRDIENETKEEYYLKLKPISQISDEDAKFLLGKVLGNSIEDIKKQFQHPNINSELFPSSLTDYLRSKGYALPYNGITVEEQIEFGWIKLT